MGFLQGSNTKNMNGSRFNSEAEQEQLNIYDTVAAAAAEEEEQQKNATYLSWSLGRMWIEAHQRQHAVSSSKLPPHASGQSWFGSHHGEEEKEITEETVTEDGSEELTTAAGEEDTPASISITVLQSRAHKFEWSFELKKNEATQEISIAGIDEINSDLTELGPDEGQQVFLQVGDVLQTINYCECHLLQVQDVVEMLAQAQGLVTLEASRPGAVNKNAIQAVAVTWNYQNRGIQVAKEVSSIGLELQESNDENMQVQVGKTKLDGYMAHSILQQGDLVQGINGLDIADLSSDDADSVLRSKFEAADYISISAIRQTPPKTWS